jgi:ABC-type multidrug transport system fused ATPase/permease subunit
MQGETTSDSAKTEIVAQTQTHPHHHTSALFDHEHHPYQPRNVNLLHEAEQKAAGVNTRIAVALTKSVGTMWTAYTFMGLAVVGLLAILGLLSPIVALLVVWISQTFLQLSLLPIIMVGQNVLGRKAELQADEQFNTTMSSYNDIENIMQHLSAQDAELLRHTRMLTHLLEKNGISLQQLEAEVTSTSHLGDDFVQSQSATDVPATSAPAESEK